MPGSVRRRVDARDAPHGARSSPASRSVPTRGRRGDAVDVRDSTTSATRCRPSRRRPRAPRRSWRCPAGRPRWPAPIVSATVRHSTSPSAGFGHRRADASRSRTRSESPGGQRGDQDLTVLGHAAIMAAHSSLVLRVDSVVRRGCQATRLPPGYPLFERCAQRRAVLSSHTKSQFAPPAGFEPATRGLEGLQH